MAVPAPSSGGPTSSSHASLLLAFLASAALAALCLGRQAMFGRRPRSRVIGIIPARYASSRFPGKPLTQILGKSMIQVQQAQWPPLCRPQLRAPNAVPAASWPGWRVASLDPLPAQPSTGQSSLADRSLVPPCAADV
jgi:hypothetical protein